MRAMLLSLTTLALFASGCQNVAPTSVEETGEAVKGCKQNEYPCGPFGSTVGSVIADAQFTGLSDSNGNGYVDPADAQTTFSFGDYFNNNGKKKLPKVLALNICAIWCGPCQLEASTTLNPLAQGYASGGAPVEFLSIIEQNVQGSAPTTRDLDQWAARFKPAYDLAIDADQVLAPTLNAFPTHLVVRTADMQITFIDEGSDATAWKAAIDAVLAE